jgi:hypothetical protein
MRVAWLVALLVACDAGAKKTEPAPEKASGASVVPAPLPIDATPPRGDAISEAQALPCSAKALGLAGAELPARGVALDDCDVRWFPLSKLHDHRPKPSASGPRFVDHDHQLWAIETRSKRELDQFVVSCPHPPPVDWKSEHLWIVVYVAPDGDVDVESTVDDGQVLTLALRLQDRGGCGGARPVTAFGLAAIIAPAERTIALSPCDHPDNGCTGHEK